MARLPPEIMLLIFKASDRETLMTCCDATIGNTFLHDVVTHECWHDLEIRVEDLIPAPEELRSDCTFVQRHKINLSSKSKFNQAVKYARHIRNLDFNLSVDFVPFEHIPTYETSIHSAKLLLPAATNIETLSIDGPACKEVYNTVGEIPKLRKLFIGRRKAVRRLRNSSKVSYREHWPSERAAWILPVLEEYENHQFWSSYAHQYLLTSKKLRRICINVMKPYDGYENLEEEFYDTIRSRGPLNGFLLSWNANFQESPSRELLKSLSIVDHWFQGSNATFTYPAKKESSMVRGVCLDEVYIQSSILAQPMSLLSRYPDTKLRTLRVSAARGSPESPDEQEADPYDAIQALVRHHETSLEEVVLSDAWNAPFTLCQRLESCWKEQFAFTDLTLSLPPTEFYDMDTWIGNVFAKRPLSHYLFGSTPISTRWGTQLQRICLGDGSLGIDEIDCLHDPALSNMRILILRPNPDRTLHELSCIHDKFNPSQLACSIAAKAPASLRYLAVGNKAYWVTLGKLMDFEDAKTAEWLEVQSWMTPDDLQFINPDSKWNRVCQPIRWDHSVASQPDLIAERNFLIARPVVY